MTPHQIDPTVVSHMDEQMVAVGRMRTADGWTDKAGGGGLIRYSFGSLALSLSLSLAAVPSARTCRVLRSGRSDEGNHRSKHQFD